MSAEERERVQAERQYAEEEVTSTAAPSLEEFAVSVNKRSAEYELQVCYEEIV